MATNILYMPVVAMDMTITTNADWLDGLEYWDLQTPAQPIDLAGIEFEMSLRTTPSAATVVLKSTTDNGLIVVYSNTWQLRVPAVTMALVPPAAYVYDLLGVADGYIRVLASGGVTVEQGVTRPPEVLGVPQIAGLQKAGEPLGYLPAFKVKPDVSRARAMYP